MSALGHEACRECPATMVHSLSPKVTLPKIGMAKTSERHDLIFEPLSLNTKPCARGSRTTSPVNPTPYSTDVNITSRRPTPPRKRRPFCKSNSWTTIRVFIRWMEDILRHLGSQSNVISCIYLPSLRQNWGNPKPYTPWCTISSIHSWDNSRDLSFHSPSNSPPKLGCCL